VIRLWSVHGVIGKCRKSLGRIVGYGENDLPHGLRTGSRLLGRHVGGPPKLVQSALTADCRFRRSRETIRELCLQVAEWKVVGPVLRLKNNGLRKEDSHLATITPKPIGDERQNLSLPEEDPCRALWVEPFDPDKHADVPQTLTRV
jgi:hypothetical protein